MGGERGYLRLREGGGGGEGRRGMRERERISVHGIDLNYKLHSAYPPVLKCALKPLHCIANGPSV